MMRHTMSSLLVPAAVFAFPALTTAQSVSFVESSSGLQQPGMEGGGTELEFSDVDADGHIARGTRTPDLSFTNAQSSPLGAIRKSVLIGQCRQIPTRYPLDTR